MPNILELGLEMCCLVFVIGACMFNIMGFGWNICGWFLLIGVTFSWLLPIFMYQMNDILDNVIYFQFFARSNIMSHANMKGRNGVHGDDVLQGEEIDEEEIEDAMEEEMEEEFYEAIRYLLMVIETVRHVLNELWLYYMMNLLDVVH